MSIFHFQNVFRLPLVEVLTTSTRLLSSGLKASRVRHRTSPDRCLLLLLMYFSPPSEPGSAGFWRAYRGSRWKAVGNCMKLRMLVGRRGGRKSGLGLNSGRRRNALPFNVSSGLLVMRCELAPTRFSAAVVAIELGRIEKQQATTMGITVSSV